MRATCATDLCTEFPGHVAAAWLGHTEQIADMHYRQVTDDHYASGAEFSHKSKIAKRAGKAQHNAQQQGSEWGGTGKQSNCKNTDSSESFESVLLGASEGTGRSGIRTRDNRFCKPTP